MNNTMTRCVCRQAMAGCTIARFLIGNLLGTLRFRPLFFPPPTEDTPFSLQVDSLLVVAVVKFCYRYCLKLRRETCVPSFQLRGIHPSSFKMCEQYCTLSTK